MPMPTPMAILSEVARPSGEDEGLAVWVSWGEELVLLPDEEAPDGLEVELALEVGVLVVVCDSFSEAGGPLGGLSCCVA
jgi:hypothetical protein